jgi:N-acetylglucosaminyl-diphospho-decaprenol L-rhamnosyltransferase
MSRADRGWLSSSPELSMADDDDVRLAVIVPAYGNWGDTRECLSMLAAQAGETTLVCLADDGSPEPPPAAITGIERLIYLRGTHGGFAVNCNRAAAEAIRLGATHVLLLNNDTVVGDRFIRGWLAAIRMHPAAIMSPVINYVDAPTRIWHSGGRKTIWAPFMRQRRGYTTTTPVELVCGCCLVVPASAWRALGGFDEGFAMYFEDFDLALRARRSGIDVLLLPDADLAVGHKVSGSFRGDPWSKERLMYRSRRLFASRHYSGLAAAVVRGLEGPFLLWRLVANLPAVPDRDMWREVLGCRR